MIKNILSCLFLFILLIINFSCNTTEPPPPEKDYGTITLSVLESSCTEAWVNIKANGVTLPVNLNILKDNSIEETFTLNSTDTTIYIDSLTANTNYNLKARFTVDGQTVESSQLTAKTLNTTSHNFTWQTYEFGDPTVSSCQLNDVVIIDENNIWAVGEIYMRDTNGNPDPNAYCLAKWNGQQWLMEKFSFKLYNYDCTVAGSYYGTAKTVYVFNDEIIFTDGVDFVKWDGNTYSHLPCLINLLNGSIKKIWGYSSEDFYAVGTNGTIVHYNGSSWQKIESGTTTRLNDIWGYYDNSNKSILTVASEILGSGDKRLLVITGSQAIDTLGYPYNVKLRGVWYKNNYSPVYICGGGIMEYKMGKWKVYDLSNWIIEAIRGNDVNDIIAVDAVGTIFHYNGINWAEDQSLTGQSSYNAIAIKDNTVAVVGNSLNGSIVGTAVISIGKR